MWFLMSRMRGRHRYSLRNLMTRRRSRHRLVQGLLQAADELVDCNLKTHWCDITLLSQWKQGGKKRGFEKLGVLSCDLEKLGFLSCEGKHRMVRQLHQWWNQWLGSLDFQQDKMSLSQQVRRGEVRER